MPTATRFLILMHPKELKRVRLNTGRLTQLCLENSEIRVGIGFDGDAGLRARLADPEFAPALLFPGAGAREIGAGGAPFSDLGGRRPLIVVLDATWSLARKMLHRSACLQALPRLAIAPAAPSRYVIKRQPAFGCLSTLEAVHETLAALDRAGLDRYPDPEQLLGLFQRMQELQLAFAADPEIGRRRRPRPAIPSPPSPTRRGDARRIGNLFAR
jgi:DTW domain-containing protein YfiP